MERQNEKLASQNETMGKEMKELSSKISTQGGWGQSLAQIGVQAIQSYAMGKYFAPPPVPKGWFF